MQAIQTVLGNRLLIDIVLAEKVTNAGIILPDTVERRQDKGIVIKAGVGTPKNPVKIKEGATIFLVKGYATKQPVEHEGRVCYLVHEDEVLTYIPKN